MQLQVNTSRISEENVRKIEAFRPLAKVAEASWLISVVSSDMRIGAFLIDGVSVFVSIISEDGEKYGCSPVNFHPSRIERQLRQFCSDEGKGRLREAVIIIKKSLEAIQV